MEVEYNYDYFRMYHCEAEENAKLREAFAKLQKELEATKKELSEAYEIIITHDEEA